MNKAKRIFYLFMVFALVSCATSHKTATTEKEYHQIVTEHRDTTRVQTATTDSTYHVAVSESTQQTHAEQTDTTTETITEHIVEVYDSAGVRQVTTDRTTVRKNGIGKTIATRNALRQREESLAVLLSALDSISQSRELTNMAHGAERDSVNRDKQTGMAVTRTCTVVDVLGAIVTLMVLIGVYFALYMAWLKVKGKI